MKKENHLNQNEKEGGTILQLAVYLVIILLINIAGIVAGLNFRIDLTGNDLYSLSEKSADVVSNLKENLTIKVLFSENLPGQFLKVSTQLKDLLEVYDYEGNEHFSYEIIRGKDLEAQAKDYGIEPLRTREIVDDEETGRISYMGIVIQHADLVEKMPRLITTEGLEYEITSRINKMSTKIDTLLGMKKEEMVEITLYLDSAVRQLPIDEINTVEKRIEDAVMGINPQNYNKLKFQLIDPSTQKEVSIINPKGSNEANEPKEAKPVSVADQYGINKLEWAAMTTASGEKLEAGSGVMAIIVKKGKRFKKINLNVANIPFTNKFIIPGLEKLDEMIGNAVSGVLGINQQIGYISGHGSVALNDPRGARGQNPQGLKFLKELLSDMYEIKAIDLSQESISDDIGTIIINGPKTAFTESELFKIDQFLLSGKSAVFFIDSFNEMQLQRGQQPVVFPVNTGLDKLLGHYGISVNKDIVLDSSCRKIPIQGEYREYYALPVIQQAGINMDSIITKYLKGAIFFKSSSITLDEKKLEKQGAESKELINSSGESWLMTGRINFDPRFMFPGKKEDMKSYTMAALASGKFESYFKGKGIPVDESEKKPGKKELISSGKMIEKTIDSGKSKILVVGTSEITSSGFIRFARSAMGNKNQYNSQDYSNDHFLHSMMDYMTGNSYVTTMKRKQLEYNPLDATSPTERIVYKVINIAGVPHLILLIGLFVWIRRGSRKKALMKEFSK